jgi:hypothetical protein
VEEVDYPDPDPVAFYCREAQESENPLLFFQALSCALHAALNGAYDKAEAGGAEGTDAARAVLTADHYVRLPPALHNYLRVVTWRLCKLEAGRDFRECSGEPFPDADGRERLAPDIAARLVPQALGIVRPGFNAFLLSERQDRAALARDAESEARERGLSPLQARLEAMERLGFNDERSYRRLLKGKRRTRGKPAP